MHRKTARSVSRIDAIVIADSESEAARLILTIWRALKVLPGWNQPTSWKVDDGGPLIEWRRRARKSSGIIGGVQAELCPAE